MSEAASPTESRAVLLRLLTTAHDLPLFQHLSVGHQVRPARLLEVFIAAFLNATAEIVKGGLLRQYQEEEDDLRVVRGQILARRQFGTLFNRPDVIACRFDDLTADNIWNRIIKAGLRAVRPWIVSVDVHRLWVELMTAFADVDDWTFDRGVWSRLIYDRHAARYRRAAQWVRWILSLLSPALRAGREDAPGLLFDMNVLFQSAIAAALERATHGTDLEVIAQGTGEYLARVSGTERRAFALQPDLLVQRRGRVVAIGDTKWKRLKIGRGGALVPAPEDVYQLQAYSVAYRCSELAVIYPWDDALDESAETVYELPATGGSAPRLTVICVDLERDPLRLVRGMTGGAFAQLLVDPWNLRHAPVEDVEEAR